jgi:hypothetical protein
VKITKSLVAYLAWPLIEVEHNSTNSRTALLSSRDAGELGMGSGVLLKDET